MLRLSALAVVLLALASFAAAAQQGTPTPVAGISVVGAVEGDSFYEPPSPLPEARPGTLIRSEEFRAPAGVRSWRILYHSTGHDGEDVAVSGTVFVPEQPTPPGRFPLIAMGHNTTGIARICAPSLDPFVPLPGADEAFYEQQVAGFVAGGFAVVATDYQGLGAVYGVHPFLVGESAAYNVLDVARAVRALPGLTLSPETLLWGHSQGGHAAAWTGQLASTYAPDLSVTGVILAAPAAEPGLLLAAATKGQTVPTPLTGYIVALISSWSGVYPEVASTQALTPAALEKIDLLNRECIPAISAAFGDQPLSDYVDPAVLASAPWTDLLEQNAAGRQPIGAPVLVVQGTADPLVPAVVSEAFVRQMCDLGTDVQLQLYPEVGHGAVIAAAMPDLLTWASDRLEGNPTASTC